jgi:hypothetical protein
MKAFADHLEERSCRLARDTRAVDVQSLPARAPVVAPSSQLYRWHQWDDGRGSEKAVNNRRGSCDYFESTGGSVGGSHPNMNWL